MKQVIWVGWLAAAFVLLAVGLVWISFTPATLGPPTMQGPVVNYLDTPYVLLYLGALLTLAWITAAIISAVINRKQSIRAAAGLSGVETHEEPSEASLPPDRKTRPPEGSWPARVRHFLR